MIAGLAASIDKPRSHKDRDYLLLLGVVAAIAVGIMIYAETDAFAWDEGFHMLTAQLITRGKRPYLDFNFSQTPLNAYWNALWMLLFGQSWRTAHAVAAIMTSASVFMTADFLYFHFPVPRWRFPVALFGALAVGSNVLIVQFGTIGQAYGFCLVFDRRGLPLRRRHRSNRSGLLFAVLAGLLSSAGAGATQLTAPVCPVLAIWMFLQNRAGNRMAKLAAFIAASVVPLIPVIYLFAKGPKQTLFNIIEYNLIFRQVEWPHAIRHDIGVLISWSSSSQALLTGLIGLGGLLCIRFRSKAANDVTSNWTREQRSGILSLRLACPRAGCLHLECPPHVPALLSVRDPVRRNPGLGWPLFHHYPAHRTEPAFLASSRR